MAAWGPLDSGRRGTQSRGRRWGAASLPFGVFLLGSPLRTLREHSWGQWQPVGRLSPEPRRVLGVLGRGHWAIVKAGRRQGRLRRPLVPSQTPGPPTPSPQPTAAYGGIGVALGCKCTLTHQPVLPSLTASGPSLLVSSLRPAPVLGLPDRTLPDRTLRLGNGQAVVATPSAQKPGATAASPTLSPARPGGQASSAL